MLDRDWTNQAETLARRELRARKKEISDEALAELVGNVGPNARLLVSEVEKLALFAGDRAEIEAADVASVCTRNKSARAFALGLRPWVWSASLTSSLPSVGPA